jgi:hypothetical protein
MALGLGIGLTKLRTVGGAGPVNTVAPVVTGTTERGEMLSCTTGTWTGVGTITYAYQWRRNGANITGATSSTYTLVVADDDADINCVVTATDNEGSSSRSSNVVGPVLGDPLNLTLPSITGTATVRETLTVSNGTWQGIATITFAYQWRKNGVNISGATNSTYTLLDADYNSNIDCIVTATNSLGSTPATAPQTAAIAGLAPTIDTAPVISGSTSLGSTLTRTSQGVYNAVPAATITGGQWRRNGTPIAGETGTTYDITLADSGADIDYLETASNVEGSITSDSNDITAQTFTLPTNSQLPVISGTVQLGDTLTVTEGTWIGNPTPTVTGGQWFRNGVFTGETGTTYLITLADDNAEITYVETASNAVGSNTATSDAVQIADFTAPVNTVAPSITGDDPATIDDVLTRVEGTWSGNPAPTLTGEWYRNNVATGETGSTYTVTAADDNSFIFYRETATNAIGSASEDSAAVTVEDFTVPVISGSPTIAGTEEVGETLTATAAAATGNPTPVRTWQWQRSEDGSTGWADIAGATNSTYLLDAADEGNFVRVKQIETNVLGSDEAVSAASGEIQPSSAAGLLDSYKGSAFAMSPDTLLYSTYSATDDVAGSVTNGDTGQFSVTVYRDSDNAMRSFTPAEVADGTANTWRSAAGAANGFVRRGYDQSVTALDVSNLNHANQTTTANMPKLFDSATGLILENGKAALHFDGVDDYMQAPNGTIGSVTNLFFIYVGQILNTGAGNYVFAGVSDGGYTSLDEWFTYQGFQNKFRSSVAKQNNQSTAFSSFSLNTNQFLASIQFLGGSQIDLSINNNISSTPTSITSLNLNQEVDFSAVDNSGSIILHTETKQQCVLFWTTDQTANRTAISGLLNTEYNNIY